MNRKSLNIQFGLVAGLAISSSFATEVDPDRFAWSMPLAIAVCRLFVVAYTSKLKDLYPLESNKFDGWAISLTSIIAVFIYWLYARKENPIGADTHWGLQVLNIMIVGAEFYYGRLILKTDEVKTNIQLIGEIETLNRQIETERNQIELDRQGIEADRIWIGENRPLIESNRKRIGSLESEIGGLRLKIGTLETQIAQAAPAIEIYKKLIGGVKISAGMLYACEDCGELAVIGHRAKDKTFKCNCK